MSLDLYAQLQSHDTPAYSHECGIKRALLFRWMYPQVNQIETFRDEIFTEHAKLVSNSSVIKFEGRRYPISVVGEPKELHPSLHTRMGQWVVLSKETSISITLLNNYIGDVLLKGKRLPDALQLLNPAMHSDYLDCVEQYAPVKLAQCWNKDVKIRDSVVASFKERHATAINVIQALELNKLTL